MAMRARNIDLSRAVGGEGQPAGEVLVVGTGNNVEYGRIAGGSVADTANANAVGGMLVVHIFNMPDAPAQNLTLVLAHRERVIAVWIIKTGGAGGTGDTAYLQDADNHDVVSPMSIDVADKTIVRAATIDDAYHEVGVTEFDEVLKVVVDKTSAANVACVVYVLCLRVA